MSPHGTISRYQAGCRGCQPCREAHAAAWAALKKRHHLVRSGLAAPPLVDAVGARRRLQALATLGYGLAQLAARSGVSLSTLSAVRSGRRAKLTIDAHRRIARTYRALVASPLPMNDAMRHARREGWSGPLEWAAIDDPHALPESWRNAA